MSKYRITKYPGDKFYRIEVDCGTWLCSSWRIKDTAASIEDAREKLALCKNYDHTGNSYVVS